MLKRHDPFWPPTARLPSWCSGPRSFPSACPLWAGWPCRPPTARVLRGARRARGRRASRLAGRRGDRRWPSRGGPSFHRPTRWGRTEQAAGTRDPRGVPRRGAAQVHSAQVHCRQNVCEEGDGQQGGHITPGVDITTSPRARHRPLYRRMTRRGITTIDRDSGPAALGPTRRVVAPEVIRVPVEPHRFGAADGTVSGGTQRVRFCIRPLRCVSATAVV